MAEGPATTLPILHRRVISGLPRSKFVGPRRAGARGTFFLRSRARALAGDPSLGDRGRGGSGRDGGWELRRHTSIGFAPSAI